MQMGAADASVHPWSGAAILGVKQSFDQAVPIKGKQAGELVRGVVANSLYKATVGVDKLRRLSKVKSSP